MPSRGRMRGVILLLLSSLTIIASLAFLLAWPSRVELVEDVGKSLMSTMYKEDVQAGREIMAKMKAKMSNPILKALAADKVMRTQLAAALGAEERGGKGGGVNLGSLLGGAVVGGSHAGNTANVRQHRLTSLSGKKDIEASDRSTNSKAQHHHALHRQLVEEPSFVYNAFASGVLDGKSSSPPAEDLSSVAAERAGVKISGNGKKIHIGFEDGVKQATGFDDSYKKVKVAVGSATTKANGDDSGTSSRVKKLEEEVAQLMKTNEKKSPKEEAIDLVESVIHQSQPGVHRAHSKVSPVPVAPSDEQRARLAAFIKKLATSRPGSADAAVLNLLKNANVLKVMGQNLKGQGVASVLKEISGDVHTTEKREQVLDAKEDALMKREKAEKAGEAREAEALQDSIKAETDIVFGSDVVNKAAADDKYRTTHPNELDNDRRESNSRGVDAVPRNNDFDRRDGGGKESSNYEQSAPSPDLSVDQEVSQGGAVSKEGHKVQVGGDGIVHRKVWCDLVCLLCGDCAGLFIKSHDCLSFCRGGESRHGGNTQSDYAGNAGRKGARPARARVQGRRRESKLARARPFCLVRP